MPIVYVLGAEGLARYERRADFMFQNRNRVFFISRFATNRFSSSSSWTTEVRSGLLLTEGTGITDVVMENNCFVEMKRNVLISDHGAYLD